MTKISELMRKARRGEATDSELDFLDSLEKIPPSRTDSRVIPLLPGITQITSDQKPSENLAFLKQEFAAKPKKDTPCTDCEEHQKKPSRKSRKPKESSDAKVGNT